MPADIDSPRHPIQVVSRRTGISPDVLRAWERRYRAVTPNRSETRRRLYSDADIERLTLLREATEAGRSIGLLAEESNETLRKLITDDQDAIARHTTTRADTAILEAAQVALSDALDAVRNLDAAGLRAVLSQVSLLLGPGELIERIFVPLMRTVGDLWHRGELGIAHEHLASAIVRGMLSEFALFRGSADSGPRLVVSTPAGQYHEMGALVVSATAASTGWNVTYIGSDVPASDIADAVTQVGARAVALSITLPDRSGGLNRELGLLGEHLPTGTTLLVGGLGVAQYYDMLRQLGALVLSDTASLRSVLSSLRSENGGRQ